MNSKFKQMESKISVFEARLVHSNNVSTGAASPNDKAYDIMKDPSLSLTNSKAHLNSIEARLTERVKNCFRDFEREAAQE